jgi:putative transposase|nr:transposase [Pseudanabaena cinerea]
MLVLEAKLEGKIEQYNLIDEAICTALFVRNKALRYWMDNHGADKYDLSAQCAVLAKECQADLRLFMSSR